MTSREPRELTADEIRISTEAIMDQAGRRTCPRFMELRSRNLTMVYCDQWKAGGCYTFQLAKESLEFKYGSKASAKEISDEHQQT